MQNDNFEQLSYNAHENMYVKSPNPLTRIENKESIDYWRHERMYKMLSPLLQTGSKWLTVGDGIGTDANWLIGRQVEALATDIADSVLKESKLRGYISDYKKENAEKMSFGDNKFDYVLCKEAYHHFPRPYLALYEMIRVSSKAVILIEPLDVGIQVPYLIWLKNILDRINVNLINKLWKNRYSFEEVGNYVYKISEREMEKVAAGINLPAIAFKRLNDYYSAALDLSAPLQEKKVFRKVRFRIYLRNILSITGLIPPKLLICIIFKTKPATGVISDLRKKGYKYINLPDNPYLKNPIYADHII